MSQSLVATIASIGGILVAIADGPRSVRLAAVVCGLCLAPAAASVGGSASAALLIGAGVLTAVAAMAAALAGERLAFVPGLDPLVPVVAPRQGLFGPRSVRVFGAVVALVAASWLGLNVQVGIAATASGSVFASAYVWLVGVMRLLRARAVEELAVGAVAVALATACGWVLEAGPNSLAEAAAVAGLAPAAGVCAGWLAGRHGRRARLEATSPSADEESA
jgi:hypothetical protein